MPNYVGGITAEQLGAEVCNEGVQTSAYSVQTSAYSMHTKNEVVYTL